MPDPVTMTVTITVTCKTTGWISVGPVGPDGIAHRAGGMDVWTMAFVPGKTPVAGNLVDTTNNSPSQPVEDTTAGGKNDLTLLSATQVNGVTTISFKRPFDTGDKVNDIALTNTMQKFTYAYSDPGSTDFQIPHSFDPAVYATWYFTANMQLAAAAAPQAPVTVPLNAGNLLGYIIAGIAYVILFVRVVRKLYKALCRPRNRGDFEIAVNRVEMLPVGADVREEPSIVPPKLPAKKKVDDPDDFWQEHFDDEGTPCKCFH